MTGDGGLGAVTPQGPHSDRPAVGQRSAGTECRVSRVDQTRYLTDRRGQPLAVVELAVNRSRRWRPVARADVAAHRRRLDVAPHVAAGRGRPRDGEFASMLSRVIDPVGGRRRRRVLIFVVSSIDRSMTPRSRSSVGERPPHTRKVAGSIPAGTTSKAPVQRSFSELQADHFGASADGHRAKIGPTVRTIQTDGRRAHPTPRRPCPVRRRRDRRIRAPSR